MKKVCWRIFFIIVFVNEINTAKHGNTVRRLAFQVYIQFLRNVLLKEINHLCYPHTSSYGWKCWIESSEHNVQTTQWTVGYHIRKSCIRVQKVFLERVYCWVSFTGSVWIVRPSHQQQSTSFHYEPAADWTYNPEVSLFEEFGIRDSEINCLTNWNFKDDIKMSILWSEVSASAFGL